MDSTSLIVYKRLKKAFQQLWDVPDPHLTDAFLRELDVEVISIDLEQETQHGGPYFLPMSQDRVDHFCKQNGSSITFDPECDTSVWDVFSAYRVHDLLCHQYEFIAEKGEPEFWASTSWRQRHRRSKYQKLLDECGCRDGSASLQDFSWRMYEHFVSKGFPHRSCISRTGLEDVRGLVSSEMMIVIGMMISAMREKGNADLVVVPLVLVSIVGMHARVIQAHVSPEEHRLKVRHSQLYSFDNSSQRQTDLFVRWIFSSPLVELKSQPEAEKPPGNPTGDTASRVAVSKGCKECSKSEGLRRLRGAASVVV